MDIGVVRRGRLQHIVRAKIHNHETIVIKEAKAVRARLERLTADLNGNFHNQVGLIFLAYPRGIAGTIDESREYQKTIGVTHAAGVVHLDGSGLSAEEDRWGKEMVGDIRSRQYPRLNRLSSGRACSRRRSVLRERN